MSETREPVTCGCDAPYYALGLCARHYWRQYKRTKNIPKPLRQKNLSGCSEPGCPHEFHAKGLCQRHYQRLKRSRLPLRPPRPWNRNPLAPKIEELALTMTQSQIAKLLQGLGHEITRMVVIGVVDRARLAGRIPALITEKRRRTYRETRDKHNQACRAERQFWRRVMGMPDYVPPREFPPPGSCLWMDGDPHDPNAFFCGEPVAYIGEAWCSKHRRRVYRPILIVSNSDPAQTHALEAAAAAD